LLFNSFEYVFLFLPITFILYFVIPTKFRWLLLLIASYFFYGIWRLEFLLLILISTTVDFFAAKKIEKQSEKKSRKRWLYLSLAVNIGLLLVFKYMIFINDTFHHLFKYFDLDYPVNAFDILLPIGISFYTFQTIGYTIDVYQKKIKAENHFGKFALYVSFFPQLVAGPIERSTKLLPQLQELKNKLDLEKLVSGGKLMVYGLLKKMVLADNIAPIVNAYFEAPNAYPNSFFLFALPLFFVQMYLDFSAYSDIAIGTARMFGINLSLNFNKPLNSKTLQQYWSKWHISLTQWFYNYLYVPIRRNLKWNSQFIAVMLYFAIIGIWHGAGLNFLIFGLLHGFFFYLGDKMKRKAIFKQKNVVGKSVSFLRRLAVFAFVCYTMIFFRAETFIAAKQIHLKMFAFFKSNLISNFVEGYKMLSMLLSKTYQPIWLLFLALFLILQAFPKMDVLHPFNFIKRTGLRWALYFIIVIGIILYSNLDNNQFIYFQF